MLKKCLTILIFLIIAIGAVSAVSAEDIAGPAEVISDDVAIDENIICEGANEEISASDMVNDDVSVSEEVIDDVLDEEPSADISTNDEINDDSICLKDNDDKVLSANNQNQVLGAETESVDVLKSATTETETLSASNNASTLKVVFLGQTGNYARDKKLKFKVVEEKSNTPLRNAEIFVEIYKVGGEDTDFHLDTIKTNANGIGYIPFEDAGLIGTLKVIANVFTYDESKYKGDVYCPDYTTKVRVLREPLRINPVALTTYYNSNRAFNIRVLDRNYRPVSDVTLTVNIYTGGRYKTVTLTTNSRGIAQYKSASKLSIGTHRVRIRVSYPDYCYSNTVSSYIRVQDNVQIKTEYGNEVQLNEYNRKQVIGGYLAIYVKDKKTRRLTNGIPVTLKIRNGYGYKTVKLVTGRVPNRNLYGVVGYSTNMLSVGKHRVKVIINTKKYKGTAYTYLVIPRSSKNFQKWFVTLSRGKGIFKKY